MRAMWTSLSAKERSERCMMSSWSLIGKVILDGVSIDVPGCTEKDESVNGTITVPEVAHDTEEDEYVVCPSKSIY